MLHKGKIGRPEWLPDMTSACEGPPLELAMGISTLLMEKKWGTPKNIHLFTNGEIIADDAGVPLAKEFLGMAVDKMGMNYTTNCVDIKRITKEGIEFENGKSIDCELKIVLPNWGAHDFMKQLSIVDEVGFVITDNKMRTKQYQIGRAHV